MRALLTGWIVVVGVSLPAVAEESDRDGVLDRLATVWSVEPWLNLSSGRTTLAIDHFRRQVLYWSGFQPWYPRCGRHGFLLSAIGAVSTARSGEDETNGIRILVDAAHPWRPPFGLDRIGRPLTVEVESQAKSRPSGDYLLAGFRDGRVVARHKIGFPNAAPFITRVTFEHWPDEIVLFRVSVSGPVEVVRRTSKPPLIEVDAVAAPDVVINPVDLGAVLVPADRLMLAAGQDGHVDIAALSRVRDFDDLDIDVWFASAPERKTSRPLSLEKNRRERIRVPLPSVAPARTRDVLHVSLRGKEGELWREAIPATLVPSRPNWPRFGASETKLRYDAPILIRRPDGTTDALAYERGWDETLKDVVVSLPNGSRFVFWRGSSYVPFWAGVRNTGFTYEWAETRPPPDGFVDAVEPLMDKELRYGRVEIVASTESRVHVRWKYQSCDFNYKVWGDSAVEDFYFYPDGFGTRVVTLTSTPDRAYELIEFIVLTPQSTYPLSVLPPNLVDVLFLDGRKRSLQFPFLEPPESENRRPRDVPAVWRVRLHKREGKTAISFSPRETHQPYAIYAPFRDRGQLVTPVYWGSHWPLARGQTTGRGIDDGIHKTPAHNSIMTWGYDLRPAPLESRMVDTVDTLGQKRRMHVQTFAWLIGMTDDADARLVKRARSYSQPPDVAVTGGRYEGWKADRRAHRIAVAESPVMIRIAPRVPCVNPVFELADARTGLTAVVLDGRPVPREDYAWDGQTLWLGADITRPTTLHLAFESP